MSRPDSQERGIALITMLILLALLMALILTHFSLTWVELATTRSTMRSFVGFYAAEAGLNLRSEQLRATFVGFAQPAGASPTATDPCDGSNLGSGDFACSGYSFQERNVTTYVEEPAASAAAILVARGELYGNLHGRENHYAVHSIAAGAGGSTGAILENHLTSRRLPLFQFAAFYDKDLEILSASSSVLAGPVHTNGDLYLGTDTSLDLTHPITVAGSLFRGRKDADSCMTGPVRVADPDDLTELPTCSAGRLPILQADITAWNRSIRPGIAAVAVPAAVELDPAAGRTYWDRADLRIALDVATSAITIRNADGTVDSTASVALGVCGVLSHTTSMVNRREGLAINMLDVDLGPLIDCVQASSLMGGTTLDDTVDGGLVWHFTVVGPDSAVLNNYGVRIANGAELVSTIGGAPAIRGLTIVTDQALYIQGNYNTVNRKPAAFLADSLNVLSGSWNDAYSMLPVSDPDRTATSTTIHAAFLAGTDSTGGAEGAGGRDAGDYNGGLENFVRLHEGWGAATLTYRGSLVSLFRPRHVDGLWAVGDPYYTEPTRDWVYEDEFDDPAALPPLTPSFVYLSQELFVRHFEL